MSYVTENCVWLSAAFTQQIKDVVARFYELADSTSPDAGSVMASDVFSKDAVLIGPTGTFTGSEEISHSRENAWSAVQARKHTINKAFFGQAESQSAILLGAVHMDMKGGNSVDASFSCHIELETSGPKSYISYMKVFPSAALPK